MNRVFLCLLVSALPIYLRAAEPVISSADTAKVSKSIQLEEVVVQSMKVKSTTPVAYTEVSAKGLERRSFGQDVSYLASTTPSVVVTSDAGTGIGYTAMRIRGTDATRINITVNGVPLNESESQTVFWVNMPDFVSSMQSLQIQRGVGTSTNGAAAFGATFQMQTQALQSDPYAEASSSVGSFSTMKNTFKVGTGLLPGGFAFDARYSTVDSKGYVDRASVDLSSYYAQAAWYGDATMVKFLTFGSTEKTYQAWGGISSDSLQTNRTYNPCGSYWEGDKEFFYNNQTDNYTQRHYHLSAVHRWNAQWSANATLHYTAGQGYYEDYKEDAKLQEYKLSDVPRKSDLIRQKWLDNDFYGAVASVEYKNQALQLTWGAAVNNYDGNHFGNVLWTKDPIALPQSHEYYRGLGTKLDYNTFLKAHWRILPSLFVYGDLQYRGIDYRLSGEDDKAGMLDIHKKFNFFNPKAGVNYQNRNHSAYASFAVANREPSRNNFTEAGPNDHPTFETLYDWEAGYNYRTSKLHAGAALYFMNYRNQLLLTGKISDIGEPLTANIDRSYRAGIELIAGVKIASFLDWNVNATFSRNKILDFTEYVDDYDTGEQRQNTYKETDIALSPSIIANSVFDFHLRGFSASLVSQFVGKQYIDNTSSDDRKIDPYFVNNIQVGYAFKAPHVREIALDLLVNNIFNTMYETNAWVYSYYEGGVRKKDDGYFAQAGTNMMVRLSIKL